jgi:cytochrome b561
MRLRNGEHGYGVVTKTLHWLTVAAVVAQFTVGWTMTADDTRRELEKDELKQLEDFAKQQDEATEEWIEREIDRLEDGLDAREDSYFADAFTQAGLSLPEVHVLLGFSIVLLALIRVLWRTTTSLPPWAEHLSAGERRLEGRLEKALLTLLFVVPPTGLALLALGDDWLPLHITAQLVLLAAIAIHVGLVLTHTVVHRDRHLARML